MRDPVQGFFIASVAADAAALALAAIELAAPTAELAAMDAESAAEAAIELAPAAAEAVESDIGGVVTTTAGVVEAGGVTTVSSFLLHAENEIAATTATNNIAFFMLVSSFIKGAEQLPVIVGTLHLQSPSDQGHGDARAFRCLAHDYRQIRDFP